MLPQLSATANSDGNRRHYRTLGAQPSTLHDRYHSNGDQISLDQALWHPDVVAYSGGTQSAKVAEAIALRDKSLDERDAARRQAVLTVKTAFFGWQAGRAKAAAAQTAMRSATTQLAVAQKGFADGLKTEADVLAARQLWMAARQDRRKGCYTFRNDVGAWYSLIIILRFQNLAIQGRNGMTLQDRGLLRPRCAWRDIRIWLPACTAWMLVVPAVHAATSAYACLIEPAQTVELGLPVGGMLERVLVKRGDRVKRGQVLASLESRTEIAATELARYKSQMSGPIQLAQSKIEFAQRKYERRSHMAAEKLMSKQDSDDAEAEFKQAQAELKVAQENHEVAQLDYVKQKSELEARTLHSPFDGVVVDQMMWPGETVEPGATKHAILKLAQLDPLHVRVVMPMQAFGQLQRGMSVAVIPETHPGKTYDAKVSNVDRIIDAASGTFVVLLDLPNPKLDLPSGVKCQAAFEHAKH